MSMSKLECDVCHRPRRQCGHLAKLSFICRKVKTKLNVCAECGRRLADWFKRGLHKKGEFEVHTKTIEHYTVPPRPLISIAGIMSAIGSIAIIAIVVYLLLK